MGIIEGIILLWSDAFFVNSEMGGFSMYLRLREMDIYYIYCHQNVLNNKNNLHIGRLKRYIKIASLSLYLC